MNHEEITNYIEKSIIDIARKCNVSSLVVIKTFKEYAATIRGLSK